MSELSKLPNVGKVLESNLNAIGITTPEQLRATGAKEAFMNIRSEVDPGACLHMLYGIRVLSTVFLIPGCRKKRRGICRSSSTRFKADGGPVGRCGDLAAN